MSIWDRRHRMCRTFATAMHRTRPADGRHGPRLRSTIEVKYFTGAYGA